MVGYKTSATFTPPPSVRPPLLLAGMFPAINEFSAVINPPQACILAVGKGESRVEFAHRLGSAEDDAAGGAPGTPIVRQVMTVQLSSDARVVDSAVAAQFLLSFRTLIEDPTLLVV